MKVCLEMNDLFPCVMSQPFCCCRKRLEQQQKMLEEDRKRRQFEEQKQKLRLLSSVKPKVRPTSHQESNKQDKDREMVFSHQVQNHSSIGARLLNVPVLVLFDHLYSFVDWRKKPRRCLGGHQGQLGWL